MMHARKDRPTAAVQQAHDVIALRKYKERSL